MKNDTSVFPGITIVSIFCTFLLYLGTAVFDVLNLFTGLLSYTFHMLIVCLYAHGPLAYCIK